MPGNVPDEEQPPQGAAPVEPSQGDQRTESAAPAESSQGDQTTESAAPAESSQGDQTIESAAPAEPDQAAIKKGRCRAIAAFALVLGFGVLTGWLTTICESIREGAVAIGLVAAGVAAAVKAGQPLLGQADTRWQDLASLGAAGAIVVAFGALVAEAIAE